MKFRLSLNNGFEYTYIAHIAWLQALGSNPHVEIYKGYVKIFE